MTSNVKPRASQRQELVTMTLVAWTTIGLLVDAYFHSTDPTLESFWTPWHALFYSGFLATALWVLRIVFGGATSGLGTIRSAPLGYNGALVGVVVFSAGGVGDAIWHTVFGVETGIDALISPTHLLLIVGLLLIASAPFRAAWGDPTQTPTGAWSAFAAPFLSALWSTALIAFILVYGFLLVLDEVPRSAFDPITDQGEQIVIVGILSIIVSTAILLTPALLMLKRWNSLPFGAIGLLLFGVTLMIATGFDEDTTGILPALLAGLVGDLLARQKRWLAAVGTPVALWGLFFMASSRLPGGLGWPPEIWGGAILFGSATGMAVYGLLEAGASSASADTRPKDLII